MPNARQDYSYIDDWKSLWEPDVEAIAYNGITCDPTRVDPKVLDWLKANCRNKPHFVKVINPNAAHGQPGLLARSSPCIAIPAPFVQEHFRELQRVVTLENGATGRKWKVSFTAAEKYPLWIQGWKRVARDNDLKPGDVVVFDLTGNSQFRFTVFDEDGNMNDPNVVGNTSTQNDVGVGRREAVVVSNSDSRRRVMSSDSDTPPETDIIQVEPATPCKRRRLRKVADLAKVQTINNDTGNTNCATLHANESPGGSGVDSGQPHQLSSPFNPLAFTVLSKRRPVTEAERQRARDMAEAHARDDATSPNFVVVMADDHVYRGFHLIVPDRFVTDAGMPVSSTRVTLVDCTGKTWEVHGRENAKFQVQFYRKPWALFALQHLLEEGDVCVFQLTCKKSRTLLVRIFRVVPIPMDGTRNSLHEHYELRVKGQS